MQKITKRKNENEKRKTKFNNAEKITKKEKRIHTKTKNEKTQTKKYRNEKMKNERQKTKLKTRIHTKAKKCKTKLQKQAGPVYVHMFRKLSLR